MPQQECAFLGIDDEGGGGEVAIHEQSLPSNPRRSFDRRTGTDSLETEEFHGVAFGFGTRRGVPHRGRSRHLHAEPACAVVSDP